MVRIVWVGALIVVTCAVARPGEAQTSTRFADARLVIGHLKERLRDERFHETPGTLTSDAVAKRLRFEELGGQQRFDISFDQLTALRLEASKWPVRAFRRSSLFLTIHYTRADGAAAFEIVRLPATSIEAVTGTLSRDTGQTVDRSPTTTSFLGLPVHIRLGDRLVVTDTSGRRMSATLSGLSHAAVDLGPSGRIEGTSILRIDVRDSLWDGGTYGALLIGLPVFYPLWNAQYCDDCSALPALAEGLAIGATIGALIDRAVMRSAFRRSDQTTPAPRVQLVPMLGERRGVMASVRF